MACSQVIATHWQNVNQTFRDNQFFRFELRGEVILFVQRVRAEVLRLNMSQVVPTEIANR